MKSEIAECERRSSFGRFARTLLLGLRPNSVGAFVSAKLGPDQRFTIDTRCSTFAALEYAAMCEHVARDMAFKPCKVEGRTVEYTFSGNELVEALMRLNCAVSSKQAESIACEMMRYGMLYRVDQPLRQSFSDRDVRYKFSCLSMAGTPSSADVF
mmetsp:Transcript_15469/g.41530  ORF Transcript_15469/g.41530 Transcript_15469/m.41530 type:complete len:155 (+) Transcript_15469:489-953(+)